ncbi:MAG: PEP-CTERM sorting domain-containing protein [Burkholderiaceae bacterium]|nr:PEP-CTERM sorting domain-containing protein [Burkholderiaceae bacterium]
MRSLHARLRRFAGSFAGALVAALALCVGTTPAARAAVLAQTSPSAVTYDFGVDFGILTGSGTGDVTALLFVVDVNLDPPRANTSGCEAADFMGMLDGSIALIQRSLCTFEQKVLNAQAAGADGVLIFNQGNTADRLGLFGGTLGDNNVIDIPVLSTTYGLGALLALSTAPITIHIEVTADDLAAVPVPATVALLILGVAGMGAVRSRRR